MENKYHTGKKTFVRKGEIACYKQSLLFSQCFPQLYIFSASKYGNGLKLHSSSFFSCWYIQYKSTAGGCQPLAAIDWFFSKILNLQKSFDGYLPSNADSIENFVQKGDIAHLNNFAFFHNVFLKLFSSVC